MIFALVVAAKNTRSAMDDNQNFEEPAPSAEESSDPSQAVNDMLSAALNEEPSTLSSEEPSYAAPVSYGLEIPHFSVLVKEIPESEKSLLLASFEKNSYGCDPENLKNQVLTGRIHLSKLTEYQAAALLQTLHRHSIAADVQKNWDALPTEESHNALSENPDASPIAQNLEGAPSVELLKDSNEVLLVTMEELPGYTMHRAIGPVYAHRSLARRFFRNHDSQELLKRELHKVSRGKRILSVILPQSAIEQNFRALFSELRKAALAQGANAVVDIRITCFPESSHLDPELEQIRMVLSGTASHIEKTTL